MKGTTRQLGVWGAMWLAVLVCLFVCGAPGEGRAEELDLDKWLDEPHVKLVAVEFYADWCKPCIKAAPKWEALRKRYAKDGLRLVVVNTRANRPGCPALPWQPDGSLCDPQGQVADSLGVGDLPSAFLWSWQGNLLVDKGHHVDQIERAIKTYLRDTPRVQVVAKNLKGKAAPGLKRLFEAELSREGKLTVVADKEMRKRLAKVRKESWDSSRTDQQRCKLGEEVSANSILAVDVEKKQVALRLINAESGCQRGIYSPWDPKERDRSASTAVRRLLSDLAQRPAKMPGAMGAISKKDQESSAAESATLAAEAAASSLRVVVRIDEFIGKEKQTDSSAESALTMELTALGVKVADDAQQQKLRSAMEAGALLKGASSEATSGLDADIILAGVCRVEKLESGLLGPSTHRFDAEIEARAILRGSGTVAGSFRVQGKGMAFSAGQAAARAAREAGKKLAAEVKLKMPNFVLAAGKEAPAAGGVQYGFGDWEIGALSGHGGGSADDKPTAEGEPPKLERAVPSSEKGASEKGAPDIQKKQAAIKVGDFAPSFVMKTLNPPQSGLGVVALKKLVGSRAKEPKKALVLSFSASYCKPCLREIPELKKVAARFADKDVLVAIVVRDEEDEGIEIMRKLVVDELALPFPVVSDRYNILSRRYGAEELPFLVVIGSDARIQWIHAGFREDTMANLSDQLTELTGGAKPGRRLKRASRGRKKK